MTHGSRWTGSALAIVLLSIGAIVLLKASGLVTVGLVTTGSMEPTLPPGSVVVALRSEPSVGDVVVFRASDGGQVVHRVVDRAPEGLVTQGDANERTDQETGMAPVPADQVNVVPTVGGDPLAFKGTWLRPMGLVAAQMFLLTIGFRGLLMREESEQIPWPLRAFRPHMMLVAAGAAFLLMAPLLHETVEAAGHLQLRALPVPTLVRVEMEGLVTYHQLGPLSSTYVDVEGTVDVVRAPALPGARILSSIGATFAMVPTTLAIWTVALAMRLGGR